MIKDRIEKAKASAAKRADAAADIDLINRHSVRELTPEEVFCFAVLLCDNEVDRDFERFDKATLEKLAGLFLGKSGIFDHNWSAKEQVARLYRTEVVRGEGRTQAGDLYYYLRGYAYMTRTEKNADLIAEIEAGIKKEVSVGCAIGRTVCSICGVENGKCEHVKGQEYGGKLCFFTLKDPTDAYEWSFVSVPAQPAAGVTKSARSAQDVDWAIGILMDADQTGFERQVGELYHKIGKALCGAQEWEKRIQLVAEAKAYLKKHEA